jgi:predicted porin
MKKPNTTTLTFASITIATALSIPAHAEPLTVYGKAHISGDYMDLADRTEVAIASNSSRLGFKGDKKLNHGFTGVWKFENEIDVMAESKPFSARNRYLGLKHNAGTLLVGYHDTPFKTFGGNAGVFHDTIGERRGILGAGNGDNKFNVRARNAILYISPNMGGVEVRAMGTTGDENSQDGGGDSSGLTSLSAVWKTKDMYAGVAYEDQSELNATEGTGLRAGAGASFGATSVNVMYEMLDSDTMNTFSRDAYGGSVKHSMGDLALKAQVFMAGDYKDTSNSSAMLYAVGADFKLDKDFTIYALFAGVNNDDNAAYVLAGSGHGEKYVPPAGESISGLSAGMIMKF